MTKVCVVNPNYYRSSGVTVAIRRIFQGVSVLGIEQYFVDCSYGNEAEDIDWIPADHLVQFRLMTPNPITLILQTVAFLRWLRHNEIRIVHVHHRRLAAWLTLWQSWGQFRLIYTGQLTYPFASWFWLFSPQNATAISRSVAENLRHTTRAKQITLISNPSDFPRECPVIDARQVQQTAVCIARLEAVKGHKYLLEAWKILADKGYPYRLLLVGEGSLKADLQAQVDALGLQDWVEFRGYQKNVAAEVDQALFAVLVSEVEGQGIVTIEAAACGRASLVTDVDGSRDCIPPEYVLPNLVPFRDTSALAHALASWFDAPDQAIIAGQQFFSFLKHGSSSEGVARQYEKLYAEAVQ